MGVNHSPPPSDEVKNEWSYTSASLYGVERDRFTCTFYCGSNFKLILIIFLFYFPFSCVLVTRLQLLLIFLIIYFR
jgi:hypothetical protein